ncbi:MAG: ABC transporter substrate-binding protein [Myxococcota bacterium]|nr:ABC transporter substrate-binding protein [Myxococcota bacterium]
MTRRQSRYASRLTGLKAFPLLLFALALGASGCAQNRSPSSASAVDQKEAASKSSSSEPVQKAKDAPSPQVEPAPAPDPEPSFPSHVSVPVGIVKRLQASMIEVIKESPQLSYPERFAAIEKIVQFSFDIPAMARATYGSGYGSLTSEQKRLWLKTYEKFHISSLASSMGKYQGQQYRTLGFLEPGPNLVIVQSKLDFPGRTADLFIDYRVFRTPEGWRIVDVYSPPTVSEVAMRRAEYQTVLARRGFDGLIAEMQSRIEKRDGS